MNEQLCEAAGDGHLALIDFYHNQGANDDAGALCSASATGQIEVMRNLPKLQEADYDNALLVASENGNLSVIDELVNWGARNINQALAGAAGCNNIEAMEKLHPIAQSIAGRADVDWALQSAASRGSIQAMNKLWAWGTVAFEPALHDAAENDQVKAIDNVVNVMRGYYTPHGMEDILRQALEFGAAKHNCPHAAERLLHHGATLDETLLWEAAKADSVDVMEIFLKRGVGDTNEALMSAARYGKIRAMETLRQWGATHFEGALVFCRDPDAKLALERWIRERDSHRERNQECPINKSRRTE